MAPCPPPPGSAYAVWQRLSAGPGASDGVGESAALPECPVNRAAAPAALEDGMARSASRPVRRRPGQQRYTYTAD